MGKRISTLGFLYWLTLLMLVGCSDTASSGSGTATGNPIIVGKVTDSLGDPITNAKIIVRPSEYLANNRNIDYLGEGTDGNGYAYSKSDGTYELEINEINEYYVEVLTNNKDAGIVKSINVPTLDSGDTFRVEDAIVEVLDTFGGNVRLHGGPLCDIEVFVLGREEVDTIQSGDDYQLLLPPGKHNFLIQPVDTASYNYEKYNGFTSETFISHINILAKDPISRTSACDSLILFNYLLFNGMFNDFVNTNPDSIPDPDSIKIITPTIIDSILKLYSDYEQGNRVTYLNIENQRAYVYPRLYLGLSELKFLRLSNCGLSAVSEKVGQLKNLDTLSLRYNHLTTLPDSITNLKDLQYLNLEGNNISSLPEDIKTWADTLDPDWETTQQ